MLLRRKLQERHYYITKHNLSKHVTDGVTVLSFSAGVLQKISAATCCLCQIVLNIKLFRKFESCVNFHVETEQRKRNCVKWELSVISATSCGFPVQSFSMQLWNMNKKKTTTITTIITTSKFIRVHTMPVHMGSTDIVPRILNLGSRWRCWSDSHPRLFTPLKVPQYQLYTKLGGPQNQARYYRKE